MSAKPHMGNHFKILPFAHRERAGGINTDFERYGLKPACIKGGWPRRTRRRIPAESGFTLIEIIVTLMLVSVLATVAGFGIVEVARGYQSARENARMSQHARIALMRITRELTDLETLTVAEADGMVFSNAHGTRSMSYTGAALLFDDDAAAADGHPLIDQVAQCSFTYTSMGGQPWTTAMAPEQLGPIGITLTLSPGDGTAPIAFSTRVCPRNNGSPNAPG